MKNRNVIIISIGLALVLPVVLIFLSIFAGELMVGSFGSAWTSTWNSLTGMPMLEYVGLHSGVTGVMVLIAYPFIHYKLQKKVGARREREEFNRRKQMLHDILHHAMTKAMESERDGKWESFQSIQVTDNHLNMLSQVSSLFSEKQSLFIRQVLELLKEISKQTEQGEAARAKQSIEELITLIAASNDPKRQSTIKNGRDLDEWLNEESLTALQLLSEETEKQGIDQDTSYQNSGG